MLWCCLIYSPAHTLRGVLVAAEGVRVVEAVVVEEGRRPAVLVHALRHRHLARRHDVHVDEDGEVEHLVELRLARDAPQRLEPPPLGPLGLSLID